MDNAYFEKMLLEGKIIEYRSYETVHGKWTYFTGDDEQLDLKHWNYLGIGTLESYKKLKDYFGQDKICPIYIEVEDGERLSRALIREGKQKIPQYAEMCRRFLADCEDFSEAGHKPPNTKPPLPPEILRTSQYWPLINRTDCCFDRFP